MRGDPISFLARKRGESAVLSTPASTAPYDPTQSGDYAPNAPTTANLTVIPAGPDLTLPDGCNGACIAATQTKPAGLNPNVSELTWRGVTWTVKKFAERHWRSGVVGYVLYLEG